MPLSRLLRYNVFPYLAIRVGDGSPEVLSVISELGINVNSLDTLEKSEMFKVSTPAAFLCVGTYYGVEDMVR